MIPLAHPRRLGLRKRYDQGDNRTGEDSMSIDDKINECLADLRRERETLRMNIASGLCSPELAEQFHRRLDELVEGLKAFRHARTTITKIPF